MTTLGITPFGGGNYETLKKAILEYNIDIPHFTKQGWNKGKSFPPKRPIVDYLSNKYKISSRDLRIRLIKEKILKNECFECGISNWQNKPLPLELDHINGDHYDNSLNNLRILCPNCHSQTPTYCKTKSFLNDPRSKKKKLREYVAINLCICGVKILKNSKQCYKCERTNRNTKIQWPTIEELIQLLKNNDNNYSQVGRILGVSDNAIRKHIKHYSA